MHPSPLLIRPFDKATDIAPLSDIWFDASLLAHPFLGSARLTRQRKLIENHYLPMADTSVACRGGRPVGFFSLLDTHIGGLFVAPRHQGQGTGRQLIAQARARNRRLSLDVYTSNVQAMLFYTALGFREVRRRDSDDEGLPFENARLEWHA